MTAPDRRGRAPRTSGDRASRVLDLAAVVLSAPLTVPVALVVAVVVALGLGRPVLFRQERAGLGGRPFVLLKFRTMLEPDPARGLTTDDERLTRLGRLLRSTSLDELPGLVAVLRGDMSLVGPRPLPTSYLELYSPEQARRHDVRPGVTGLAQVSGRNGLSWEDRLRLDVEYVREKSLLLDLRLLVRTVLVVLRRDGVSAEGHSTCPAFTGSDASGAADRPSSVATTRPATPSPTRAS